MSKLTPCNLCTLNEIRAKAERDGVMVTWKLEPLGEAMAQGSSQSWWVVRRHDQDEPVAWLMEIPDRCVC